jgi:hypothetical protein
MQRLVNYVGLFLLTLAILAPAHAAGIKTNNPEFVVKEVFCIDYDVSGVLVNKSTEPFAGVLHIAVKDEEGDIVGRNKVRLRVTPENGARFSFYYINTLNCLKHKFDFRVE